MARRTLAAVGGVLKIGGVLFRERIRPARVPARRSRGNPGLHSDPNQPNSSLRMRSLGTVRSRPGPCSRPATFGWISRTRGSGGACRGDRSEFSSGILLRRAERTRFRAFVGRRSPELCSMASTSRRLAPHERCHMAARRRSAIVDVTTRVSSDPERRFAISLSRQPNLARRRRGARSGLRRQAMR